MRSSSTLFTLFTILFFALTVHSTPIPNPSPMGGRVSSNQVHNAAGPQGVGSESKTPPGEVTLPAAEVAISNSGADKTTLGETMKELGASAANGVRKAAEIARETKI